ncbi:NAD(P)-binding protein, partial [Parathielavia appendiculata]
MAQISVIFTQFFPPKSGFTEKDAPDLGGKVYIITSSNTGIGKALAGLLYSRNATVHVATRSEEKANAAINELCAASLSSTGSLTFLHFDLADLGGIKSSVDFFLACETKLHVLLNNAAVMNVAPGQEKATTAQAYEVHMGVNCLGLSLVTKLLNPVLKATAARPKSAPGSVRAVWASTTVDLAGEKDVGFNLNNLDYKKKDKPAIVRYGYSEVGNYFQGVEYSRRVGKEAGVASVVANPSDLASDLYGQHGAGFRLFLRLNTYPVINGSYTMLYAGLSPDITLDKSGCFVIPFGRIRSPRNDLKMAAKTEDGGGNGTGPRFYEWYEAQVKPYI